MGILNKGKLNLALSLKALKAASKLGIFDAQRLFADLYTEIALENELGKTILTNLATAGDADAKAMLTEGKPGMGRIYLQLKATKGDHVAQMVLDAMPDNAT